MSMGCYYDPFTTFNLIEGYFRPSILPNLRIQFHFIFETKYNNYFRNHDRTVATFPTTQAYASATVAVGRESLSFAAVEAAIARAIRNHVPALTREREDLIKFAFEQARVRLPADQTLPRYRCLHLSFAVLIEHRHIYFAEGEDPFAMPAPEEPWFAFLEKYEEEEQEERCCCICLEKLGNGGGGGGALKTPCSHVFHGGCINKWLRKSPSCPLCRYEI